MGRARPRAAYPTPHVGVTSCHSFLSTRYVAMDALEVDSPLCDFEHPLLRIRSPSWHPTFSTSALQSFFAQTWGHNSAQQFQFGNDTFEKVDIQLATDIFGVTSTGVLVSQEYKTFLSRFEVWMESGDWQSSRWCAE